MKKIYFIIIIILAIILVFIFNKKETQVANIKEATPSPTSKVDTKNISFVIDSQPITLVNGLSEIPTGPSSAIMTVTKYFGNEAVGDLDGDGIDDVAFLVTQSGGGSGLFYYVIVALGSTDTAQKYKTTNAFLIGDRIAPQSTEIHTDSKELRVNYAERKKDEPMTATPTQGAVLLLKVTSEGVLEGLMK